MLGGKYTAEGRNVGKPLKSYLRGPSKKLVAQTRVAMRKKERSGCKVVLTRLGEGLDMGWGLRVTEISALPNLMIK